jgi:ATP-binding cassette subfamily B protein IrtB
MIAKLMKNYAVSEQGAKDMIKSVCICILVNIALMLPTGLLYVLAEDILNDAPFAHARMLLIGSILTIALLGFLYYMQYNATFFAMYQESGNKRISLAEKLRRMPLSFFDQKDSADLTTVILGDVAALEHAYSHQFSQFYGAVFSTIIIAVGLLFFQWKLALAALWMLPFAIWIVFGSKNIQVRSGKKLTEKKLTVADGIQEFIECSKDLKSTNSQKGYLQGLFEKIDLTEKATMKHELLSGIIVNSGQLLLKFGIACVALVGGSLLTKGEIDVITFFAFLIIVSRIYEPLNGSLMNLAALNALTVNVERMNEISEGYEMTGRRELTNQGCDITFDHVSFAYETGEQVLSNVSFTAKQGEVTALVGPSGCGKTTVSRLAARFWDPTGGRITVGGMNVKETDPEALLSLYSIVFQDVTLFDNTIMENIRVGKKDATDAEVMEAAKRANVPEFAEKLPDGMQTRIGENGAELSGGERQRISIARAFLKDAPIILLDEATASLDAENETKVQAALSALIGGKTVMVIAHRMRTVAQADKIIVLDHGSVVEEGSPKEMLAKGGSFAHMYSLQTQSGNWEIP